MTAIDFWYDFASPYCYLVAMRVDDLAGQADVAVAWRPLLLGPLFARRPGDPSPYQNAPPTEAAYRRRDVTRLCARYRLPLVWPSTYPRGSLLATRVALLGAGAGWGAAFARAVFHANFAEDRDIADAAVVAEILAALGLTAADWLDRAGQPAAKDALKAEVARAIGLGIFGAPTFIAVGELFWGHDRLDHALDWAARPETRVP